MNYDICIIGSGAGAGPLAYELSHAGKKVVILEKGDIYSEQDFSKDEIAYTKRNIFTPQLSDEYHTIETLEEGKWIKTPTSIWKVIFIVFRKLRKHSKKGTQDLC